jgi:acyl-coenzyme A synthetase/AMP-(fatty) acid ligase
MLYSDREDGTFAPTPLTQIRYPPADELGTPGRIGIHHTTVALGYWRRPVEQADGFAQGWFSPCDLFIRHADGRLEFTGRNDDLMKIAGQWVSTVWVEQALAQACGDSVQQITAVGVSAADGLAALSVLAVAEPERAELARQRMANGIEGLPKHRRPRWVHWVETLPMTFTGKVQRSRLRQLHEAAVAAGGTNAGARAAEQQGV